MIYYNSDIKSGSDMHIIMYNLFGFSFNPHGST